MTTPTSNRPAARHDTGNSTGQRPPGPAHRASRRTAARRARTGPVSGAAVSDQIHQIVTDRMIAAPERGTIPWNAGLAHASAGPVLAHARTPAAGTRL